MPKFKTKSVVVAAAVAVALALIPALPAAAFSDTGNVWKQCGSQPVPYIQVQSTATGRVNHSINGTVLGSWNNGSTSQSRFSLTSSTAAYYRVFLTGSGGNITYGSAVCHS